ncbi:tumor necrosis factor receptor superfamily member 11A [Centropristis striata]|uniref:tumor necrosis factor receptor superfamily member 11A n=1 Tax=Centropristis striata TaxID=184440 RepID=UPI0027E1FA7F|nr:tumor necrosis factor receptor superfamily member 11A [Centropristis striata]
MSYKNWITDPKMAPIQSNKNSDPMQPLCDFALVFLCSLSLLSPVLSLHCNDTQYAWPLDQPRLCCNKCPPGKHLVSRDDNNCKIVCKPCTGERYLEKWNLEMYCEICEICNSENGEYKSTCTPTKNAVCKCKAGYECTDQSCKQCVPMKTTTTPLTPSNTALKPSVTHWQPSQPIRETVWFLVITALLCAGLAAIVVTKIKPFLRWLETKQGCFLTKEPNLAPVATCSDDEEGISTPVQEVREKCDHCEV